MVIKHNHIKQHGVFYKSAFLGVSCNSSDVLVGLSSSVSPNPEPVSDQNMLFFNILFQTWFLDSVKSTPVFQTSRPKCSKSIPYFRHLSMAYRGEYPPPSPGVQPGYLQQNSQWALTMGTTEQCLKYCSALSCDTKCKEMLRTATHSELYS